MWKLSFVLLLAAGVMCQDLSPLNINTIPTGQLKDALRKQCEKNGAEDKTESVEKAGKDFVDCVKELINFETIKDEIEKAKPVGALDEVFGKYCAKSPQLKTCIRTLSTAVTPCLETKVRDNMGDINNATDQLIDFVCFKDGDRIALFIAEKGPECFQEKSEAIKVCGEKLKDELGTVEAAKSLTLKEQCGKFDSLSKCVVAALETCETPTPANMAESLLKFVRNGSPCKEVPVKS